MWCSTLHVAKNFIGKIGEKIFKVSKERVGKAAEEYKDMLLAALASQRYKGSWKPLSARYLAWKIRNKRDPRMLISTQEYMQAIEIREVKTGIGSVARYTYIVGLPDKIHQDSGLPFRKLARIHEFGTKPTKTHAGIPARPLWRPTQAEFKARHTAKVLEFIKYDIHAEMEGLSDAFRKAQPDYRRTGNK